MSSCCPTPENLQRRTLWTVLIINALVFSVQFTAAWLAQSSALLADSLDMLGDVIAYSVSLYAVGRSHTWLNRAALVKAAIIAIFAVVVFVDAMSKLNAVALVPNTRLMVIFSLVGLLANGFCLYLLTRHRDQNINMYSIWVCARNDIIGNLSVLLTAAMVAYWHSRWPDLIIGVLFAGILMRSSWTIMKRTLRP